MSAVLKVEQRPVRDGKSEKDREDTGDHQDPAEQTAVPPGEAERSHAIDQAEDDKDRNGDDGKGEDEFLRVRKMWR